MKSSMFLFLLLWDIVGWSQSTKERQFRTTVENIVIAFSKQDSAAVSKFINKEVGVYHLDVAGVYQRYNHFTTLTFSDNRYPQSLLSQSKNIQLLPLRYADLPDWSCDSEAWSKKGLFVDTTRTDHFLSLICKSRNKSVPDNIPAKTIQYFYNLEKKSRRIVLCDSNGAELVFYLSFLNGKWFLTIIDNASSDCGV